ncbi:uncharacterized protein LOC142417121 [Mycteria americana]|uniref:uncharacterized protein LOC142417121 n=1 Tax=Mycteria americana TaxID=33587 RepID=UPI003F580840
MAPLGDKLWGGGIPGEADPNPGGSSLGSARRAGSIPAGSPVQRDRLGCRPAGSRGGDPLAGLSVPGRSLGKAPGGIWPQRGDLLRAGAGRRSSLGAARSGDPCGIPALRCRSRVCLGEGSTQGLPGEGSVQGSALERDPLRICLGEGSAQDLPWRGIDSRVCVERDPLKGLPGEGSAQDLPWRGIDSRVCVERDPLKGLPGEGSAQDLPWRGIRSGSAWRGICSRVCLGEGSTQLTRRHCCLGQPCLLRIAAGGSLLDPSSAAEDLLERDLQSASVRAGDAAVPVWPSLVLQSLGGSLQDLSPTLGDRLVICLERDLLSATTQPEDSDLLEQTPSAPHSAELQGDLCWIPALWDLPGICLWRDPLGADSRPMDTAALKQP